MQSIRNSFRNAVVCAAAALASTVTMAQDKPKDYPSKPVTIVVPYSAGGLSDILARDMAHELNKKTGQSFVVVNKPGGAAQIAMAQLKDSPADGYTLFVGDIAPLALNAGLFPNLSYDPKKDLAPITQLVDSPILLVVKPDSPYKNFNDLIAAAKEKEQGLFYASQGIGTGGHLFGTLLSKKLDKPMTHIAYKGSVQGLQGVIGGQVDFMYDAIPSSGPQVKGARLRAVAVGAQNRTPLLPDVPTLKELGYGDIGPSFWWGVVAKAGTPEPIVQYLNALFAEAIMSPSVAKRYTDQGLVIVASHVSEFKQHMYSEIDKWSAVIKDAGMALQ